MTSCVTNVANDNTLSVAVGEDRTWVFTVRDAKTKLPIDITSARIYFTVRMRWEDPEVVIRKRTFNAGGADTQILVLDQTVAATKGKFKLMVLGTDTDGFDFRKSPLVCDCFVLQQTNKRYQVFRRGSFVLEPAATRFSEAS